LTPQVEAAVAAHLKAAIGILAQAGLTNAQIFAHLYGWIMNWWTGVNL
jgi:hypothetical protein